MYRYPSSNTAAAYARLRQALTGAALTLFACSASLAQTATGRVSGTILDIAERPVAGAQVSVASQSGGIRLAVLSGSQGAFTAVAVPPGNYTVRVDAPGFATRLINNVAVHIARQTSLPAIVLDVGVLKQSVEVTAQSLSIDTTHAEVTTTITQPQVQQLPVIGRSPLPLINIEAGVAQNGQARTTINGLRTSFTEVTLDGISVQDNFIRDNGLDFLPNRLRSDQISEFTLTLQNGAVSLLGGASHVSFATPSGTNDTHCNLYWHNRNSALAANQWFNNRSGIAKPFLNLNQAGGSVAGPMIRDRLLFYINYEAERRRAQATVNRVVLTEDARRGVFTYRDLEGRVQKLDLLRATGNQADPRATALLERVPGPEAINTFDVGDSRRDFIRNTAGLRFNVANNLRRDAVLGRFDFVSSLDHYLSGTYQFVRDEPDRPELGTGFRSKALVREESQTQLLSVGWTWAPSPAWTIETRGGFNRSPSDLTNADLPQEQLFDGFSFSNPIVNFEPQGRNTVTYQFMSGASTRRRNHHLSFGGSVRRIVTEVVSQEGLIPRYLVGISVANPHGLSPEQFFGGVSAQDFEAAQNLLATLSGFVANGARSFNVTTRKGLFAAVPFRRNFFLNTSSAYVQDSWRLLPRVNLTLGLRWEYWGRFDERDGLLISPILGATGFAETLLSNPVLDFAGGVNGQPLYAPDRNNFAPTLGVAADLTRDSRATFRAAYGINHVNDEFLLAGDRATSVNQGLQAIVQQRNLALTMSDFLPGFEPPEPHLPTTAATLQGRNPLSVVSGIDPALRSPYVQQWQAGLQFRVLQDSAIDVRYVGNRGTKLLRGIDLNQLFIEENGFLEDFQRARSNGFLAESAGGEFRPLFDPRVSGSQVLTLLPNLPLGGLLGNDIVRGLIRSGEPGELAALYVVNGFAAQSEIPFAPSADTFGAHLLTNASSSSYHAFQIELRRRVSLGLLVQANYALSKVLTDSSGVPDRFDPYLDLRSPALDRGRAEFDITHAFKANFVWPLPWEPSSESIHRLLSGWTVSGILTWQSGSPVSILSQRGSLNRRNRSAQNTAVTLLTADDLSHVVRFRQTSGGPFLVRESAINNEGSGVADDGALPFEGQVFFHPEPGKVGSLQRRRFNGPSVFDLDLAIDKSLPAFPDTLRDIVGQVRATSV